MSGPEQRWGAERAISGGQRQRMYAPYCCLPLAFGLAKKQAGKATEESGFVLCFFLSHGSCKFADFRSAGLFMHGVKAVCVPNRLHWAAASFKYGSSSLIRSEQGQRT